MAITIKKRGLAPPKGIMPPVQPTAPKNEEALETVGLAPGITIKKKSATLSIGSRVVVTNDYDHVPYYKKGDEGAILKYWSCPTEAKAYAEKQNDLDLYRVLLDNPREVGREEVLLRRWELDPAS